MGMLQSYLKLVLLFHKTRGFRGSVCVLGNQEIWATYDDLKHCFDDMGVAYRTPKVVRGHSSRMFMENPTLKALSENFVHASVFFDMLGMEEYVDVDKFEADRPILQLDLNLPVSPELHGRFDLVIDGGTAEHIFDVRTVLQNMVSMTSVGGHVMHIATFQPDHGFYAFNPCLFFDFYLANGFSDPECYVLFVDYARILETFAGLHPYLRYEYGKTTLPASTDKPFLVFFVARKTENRESMVVPTQGVFAGHAEPKPPADATNQVSDDSASDRGPGGNDSRIALTLVRRIMRRARQRVSSLRRKPAPLSVLPRI